MAPTNGIVDEHVATIPVTKPKSKENWIN